MAVASAFPHPTSLHGAMERLEFVQYDPIRRPACAQDLILRHRVTGYRCGDLVRRYRELCLEEDTLHVYGAMTRRLHRLVHPREDRNRPGRPYEPTGLAAEVLAAVAHGGPLHPRDLAARFGPARAINDWGGKSATTTRALEELHYHGLVRVVHRVGGARVYEARKQPVATVGQEERMRQIALYLVRSLAPIPDSSLRATLAQLRRNAGLTADHWTAADQLRGSGDVDVQVVEGLRYLAPADQVPGPEEVPRRVRFLAPFDPLVWDRRRFEHLWGWAYRFEAYLPEPRRRMGYYAMPMLFGDRAIGWVNCRTTAARSLQVEEHYVDGRPQGTGFRHAFDQEVAALRGSLSSAQPSPGVQHSGLRS